MEKKTTEDRVEKYWICTDCATKKGGKSFKTCNTVRGGLCGWCDDPNDKTLTPLRDFKWQHGYPNDGDDAA